MIPLTRARYSGKGEGEREGGGVGREAQREKEKAGRRLVMPWNDGQKNAMDRRSFLSL